MYTHFKKAPGDKKLGVLYVVDSVTRQWLEQARKAGQTLGPSAADGTFAAGVNHVTELMPSFMSDILSVAPEDQKVRYPETLFRAIDPHVYVVPVQTISELAEPIAQRSGRKRTRLSLYAVLCFVFANSRIFSII